MNFPKISVCVITFCQEKYIEETINSILEQEFDFEMELIISNDNSTDQTHSIISSLIQNHAKANLIRYFDQNENLGMMNNFKFILSQCKGEYISLCEGDDFWIDKYKLQKQINFLDTNKEFMLCHADIITLYESHYNYNHSLKSWNFKHSILDYRASIFFPLAFTCTSTFRNIKNLKKIKNDTTSGDWMLWVLLTLEGKAKFINEKFAVYRIGIGVSTSSIWELNFLKRSMFLIGLISIRMNLSKNYWLIKGALYFFFKYFSFVLKKNILSKIANLFIYSFKY